MVLKKFENWIEENREKFQAMGYTIETQGAPADSDKRSMTLVLNSETILGQLTFWEGGECFQEIGDLRTGEITFCKNSKFPANDEFTIEMHLQSFLQWLDS